MRLPVSRRRSRNEAQQFRQLILLLLPVQQEVPTVPTAILLTAQIAALPAVQMFRTEQTLQAITLVTLQAAMILIMIPVQTIHPMTKIIAQMMIPTTAMILISPTTVKNSPVKIL